MSAISETLTRFQGILGHSEAVGRRFTALVLVQQSQLSVGQATGVLRTLGRDPWEGELELLSIGQLMELVGELGWPRLGMTQQERARWIAAAELVGSGVPADLAIDYLEEEPR